VWKDQLEELDQGG
jgi:hypothetical protein